MPKKVSKSKEETNYFWAKMFKREIVLKRSKKYTERLNMIVSIDHEIFKSLRSIPKKMRKEDRTVEFYLDIVRLMTKRNVRYVIDNKLNMNWEDNFFAACKMVHEENTYINQSRR